MDSAPCQYPECDRGSIGRCERCLGDFCARHIWQAQFDRPVRLCYMCHDQVEQTRRQRARASAADWAIVTILLFVAAGTSYGLHGLEHLDASLTRWMFWLFLGGFVVALGRLSILLLRL